MRWLLISVSCLAVFFHAVAVEAFVPICEYRARTGISTQRNEYKKLFLSPPSAEIVGIGVKFSDVVLPTYLGAGLAYLSYKIDSENEFISKEWKKIQSDPKSSFSNIASVASVGLVSVPFMAGAHYLACLLLGVKAASGKIDVAAPGVVQFVVETSSPGPLWTQIVLPVSLGLTIVYLSYQVDRNPDYVVTLWRKLRKQSQQYLGEEATGVLFSQAADTAAVVKGEVLEEEPVAEPVAESAVVLVAEQQLQEAAESLAKSTVVATSTSASTSISAAKKENRLSPVLSLLRCLYFPWLNMFLGTSKGKRKRFAKLLKVLYLPWLDIVLPKAKQQSSSSTATE